MAEPIVADPDLWPAGPDGAARNGPPEAVEQVLTGWGGTSPSAARVSTPSDQAELVRALWSESGRGPVIARGLGRSYGDAAQCAGGLVIETTGLDRIGAVDEETGIVEVDAGVSLAALMTRALPAGWFVPVTPGTRQVTIGGAIAADIHGKNHHRDGSFCEHVESATLATPTGVYEISPSEDPELFWATAGGMGLTGVVLRARIRMRRVETAWIRVDTERHRNLDAVMAALERVDPVHRYSVAWLDCSAKGAHLGRGILDAGDHATLGDLDGRRRSAPLAPPKPARLSVPMPSPFAVVNALTVTAFNQAWYAKSPTRSDYLRHLGGFFHPLDAVGHWNRLFGRRGFVQYQFAVDHQHPEVVRETLELLQRSEVPCSMAVLKRFRSGDPGPLSFPIPGWTLALDLPVGPPKLRSALRELDRRVLAAGGRVYLAKDARLDPATFAAMYPRLGEFRAAARRVDPDGRLQSDLSRRLRIHETAS